MEIEFQGKLTEQILRKATLMAYRPSKMSLAVRIVISIIIFIAMIVFAIITIRSMDRSMDGWLNLIGMEIPGFILIYFCYLPFRNAIIAAQKMWMIPQVQESMSGVFTERGLSISFGGGITCDYPWSNFFRILLQDDLLVLVGTDGKFDCLPRSFFNSDEDWRKVQELVKYYVKTPA